MADESLVLVRMKLLGAAVMARDTKAVDRALGQLGRTGNRSSSALGGIGRASGLAQRGLAGVRAGVTSVASGMARLEAGARRGVTAVSLVAGTVGAFAAVTGASYNRMQDSQRVAFTAMLGSGEKAEALMKRIKALATDSPILDPGNTGRSVQLLLAYGLNAKKALQFTEAIGNAAAGSGKSIEESMGPAALAIGQIQSKGKLSAEELNQLAESIAVGRGSVAKELGMSGAEFEKALQQGSISSDKALAAIQRAIKKRFGTAARDAANVTEGQVGRLKEVFSSAAGQLTRPFYDAVGRISARIADRLQNVDLSKVGERIFGAVSGAAEAVAGVLGRIDWDSVLARVQDAFAWISAQAPKVMSVVGAVISHIPDVVRGVGEVVSQVIDALKPAMPFVQNVLLPLLKGIAIGVIASVVAAFKVAIPIIKVVATVLGWLGEKAKPISPLIEKLGVVIGFLASGPILKGVAFLGKAFAGVGGAVGIAGRVIMVAARLAAIPLKILVGVVKLNVLSLKLFGRGVTLVAGLLGRALTWVRRYVGFLGGLPGRVGRIAVNLVGSFVNAITRLPGAAVRIARSVVTGIGRWLGTLPGKAWTWMSGLAGGISAAKVLTALGNAGRRLGREIVEAIVAAIKAAPGAILAAVVSVLPGPVRSWLTGSSDERSRAVADQLSRGNRGPNPLTTPETNAGGGYTSRPWSWVGEHGPEIARFPAGTRIYPAGQSRRMAMPKIAAEGPLYANLVVNLDGRRLHEGVYRVERARQETR